MTQTSEAILEGCYHLWNKSEKWFRDAKIELGGELHRYVLAALVEAKNMNLSGKKSYYEFCRSGIIQKAALRLGIGRDQIGELIHVWAVVKLLAPPEGIGNVLYSILKLLTKYVRRATYGKGLHGDGKKFFEQRETWELADGAERGKELLKMAAEHNYSMAKFRQVAFPDCVNNKPRQAAKESRMEADDEGWRPIKFAVNDALKRCSPRDAAEIVFEWVVESDSPELFATHLISMLQSKDFKQRIKKLGMAS